MRNFFNLIGLFFITISFFSCKFNDIITDYSVINFEKKANYLINEEKYFYLNKLSNVYLKQNPNNFAAAYYKAFSMIKTYQYNKGLSFYLDYILNNQDMSSDYKSKWLELALYSSEQKTLHFETSGMSFLGIEIKIDTEQLPNYCNAKLIEGKESYFYLDKKGILYLINKLNKKIKKINYYKTNDFILLTDYLVFNDSINLIKYNLKTFKYTLITSFTTNKIKFIETNKELNKFIVENKIDEKKSLHFIDLNKNSVINIPDNCVGYSKNINLFVVQAESKFKIIDINGKITLSHRGKFLGFSIYNSNLFLYKDNYIESYNLKTKKEKQLIYIAKPKQFIKFKSISADVFFFVYDDFMLLYDFKKMIPLLLKGHYLSMFKNGFMYSDKKKEKIFFVSFFSFSKNFLFEGKTNIEELIFSADDSALFSAYEDGILYIYNLNEHFPIKKR